MILKLVKYVFFVAVLIAPAFFVKAYADKPIATDSRILTLVYSENEVFKIFTEYGYQSNVEFSEGEKILTLSVGDPVGFKITPAENRLFIKALQNNRHTNMTVITDKHTYQFEISSILESEEDIVYVVRFFYPEDNFDSIELTNISAVDERINRSSVGRTPPPNLGVSRPPFRGVAPRELIKENYNYSYSLTGPDSISPVKIFDNGRSTFFKFSAAGAVPSFYGVAPDGTEFPLQTRREGEFIIADTVLSRIALHQGPEVVCVFNDRRSGPPPIASIK